MTKNIKNLFFAFATCLIVILMNSCGNKATLEGTIAPAQGARVKFFHAASGGSPLTVVQNGQKWTSLLVTLKYTDSIVYAGIYPAVDYTSLPAGSTKFTAKLPASVLGKDTVVAELTQNLEDGKYYMLVAADTFPSPKLYMIPDIRDDGRNSNLAYIRFANFLVNAPTAGYDIYLTRDASKSYGNVKYGQASSYIDLPPTGAVSDTVFLRAPGATTNAYTFALGASKFLANRSFIFVLRGVVAGTGTKVPTFSIVTTN
jgi:hypothetical protein